MGMLTYSVFSLFFVALVVQPSHGEVIQESLILKHIMEDYNPDVRPEEAHAEPLHVHFEIKLQKIVKLDIKEQAFVINSFVRMKWRDPQLQWNLTDFEDIKQINVGTKLVWTPDVVLYNTATDLSFAHTDLYKTKVLLMNDGNIFWTAPVTWKVSCSFDVTWFPLDKQICSLTFGSWTYMSSQMILNFYKTETTDDHHDEFGVRSGEWEIEHVDTFNKDVQYDCCPEPFSTIKYTFTLKRMALYYVLYILLPLVSLIFLFLMIFYLPNDGGERMGFGVTILLSITVYLLVISEKLPEKSDDRPMLGLCFIAEFFILSMALVSAAVPTKLINKKTRPPSWLLKICGATKTVCCLGDSTAEERESMIEMTRVNSNGKSSGGGGAQHSDEDEEEANNKLWRIIADFMDRISFYGYLAIVIFAPMLIYASLDKTMLA